MRENGPSSTDEVRIGYSWAMETREQQITR